MSLASPALPYGMREIKLTPLTGDTLGSPVALPVSRTLSFKETEEFEQLEGDDKTVAIHGKGANVDWDLEAGGISLEAWKVLSGGTIETVGTTPYIQKKLSKKSTDARPYFQIQGRAIGDSGGDVHFIIKRAKVTGDLEGELKNGAFMLTNCSGQGIGTIADDALWDIVQQETASEIDDFEYDPVSTVTGISPTTGAAAGGTAVTITGTNLSTQTDVKFGSTSATAIVVVDDEHITCVSPAHATGVVHVTVVTAFNTTATISADQFTYT